MPAIRLRSLAVLAALCVAIPPALAGIVTNSSDPQRTGWYPDQASLTPALVASAGFAQRFDTTLDGQIYAQPIVAKNSLIVVTETNWIYRLDPETGQIQWGKQLAPPWNPADIGCGDLTPWIGVTGTPVVDEATNTVYLFTKTYAGGTSGPAMWLAHAIDIITGEERPNFPVEIGGTAQNSPQLFNPAHELQRPGLLLMNGVVYAGFGGHCDIAPWQGWIAGVSTGGVLKALWTSRGTLNGNGAAVWHGGSGIMSDGSGRIFVTTGNGGAPNRAAPGNTPPADLGESTIHLDVQTDGTLRAVDFFAPFDGNILDAVDADVGSGGPTALPGPYFGTATIPHVAVQCGKQGLLYVLNRDSLGGMAQAPGGRDAVVNEVSISGGVFGRFAVWPGDGGYIYTPTNGAAFDVLKYGLDGAGKPTFTLTGTTPGVFGFASSPAVVTSNGTASGSALVWLVYESSGSGVGGELRAYDPVPVAGAPPLRWSTTIGTATKFNPPGVALGRVYVGNRDGHVIAFGPTLIHLMVDKNAGAGSTDLSWTGGNAPFTLERAEDPDFTLNDTVLLDHQTATSFADPVLFDGKTYYYRVR